MTVTTPKSAENQAAPATGVETGATTLTQPVLTPKKDPVEAIKTAAKKVTPAKAPVAAKKVATKTSTTSIPKPAVKAIAKSLKAASVPKLEKLVKLKKSKMVRDSFTMPKDEITVIDDLKLRALKLAHPIKKSELIRAGIKALALMSDSTFVAAMKAVPTIKTGRPSK